MNIGPNWITTAGILFTATELVSTSVFVVASGTNVSYKLISGNLPNGLQFSSTGSVYGTPAAVINNSKFDFVVRATSNEGISDRFFSMYVQGPQAPIWNTSSGYSSHIDYNTTTAFLSIGPNGENFALNRQWVYYQFQANPVDAPSGTKIRYFIPENGGRLPPGLTLSQDGILSGFLSDDLVFDNTEPDTGGYDEEAYDQFSYDFGTVEFDSIGVPKIYQFKVKASDNVSDSDRFFKILVISPDMIRNPERIQMNLEPGLITTVSNYLPPPQFVKGTDLGVVRSENNETFDISAYNGYPTLGTFTYSILEGPTPLTKLPNFLTLDSSQGVIYGYIPYQPAYSRNYVLTVRATRQYSTATVTATNTFTLAIQGEVESSIEWITSSTLGTIYEGRTSELSIVAQRSNYDYSIKYLQIDGTIPPGLTLQRDGSLSGSVNYNSTGTYTFKVEAQDVLELAAIQREFTLTVAKSDNKQYTKIWVKPFLPLDKRSVYREFLSDSFVFPPSLMYRYFDPNFGVQTELKMYLEFGIERQNLVDYAPALRENFYRRKFYFGDVKVAVAKTITGTSVYEVVYVDIVDDQIQKTSSAKLGSVSRVIYNRKDIFYPSSVDNMRYQLRHLTMPDNNFIGIDDFNMPLFMRTAQEGDYKPADYMHVIPLCYVLPGEGKKIISRIKLSEFDFRQFDFDIDRMIIDQSLDNSSAKYLLFPRTNIGDTIESDQILYVFDETALENEGNTPINRE